MRDTARGEGRSSGHPAAPPARRPGSPPRNDRERLIAVQQRAGNRAAEALVQRMNEPEPEPGSGTGTAVDPTREFLTLVDENTVMTHAGLPAEGARANELTRWCKDVMKLRVKRGGAFTDRELELVRSLPAGFLTSAGIGTYAQAQQIAQGQGAVRGKDARAGSPNYGLWTHLPEGQRVLAASIAFREQRAGGAQTNPAYTLGRHLTMRGDPGQAEELGQERDDQIRDTMVDTLLPPGVEGAAQDLQDRDRIGREILTNLLILLQAGLTTRGADGSYLVPTEPVVRALAHGGRVNIRIPALRPGEDKYSLLRFIGIRDEQGWRDQVVNRRVGTHYSDIGDNPSGPGSGTMVEKGGLGASARGFLDPSTKLRAIDIAGGGMGNQDFNEDVILPLGRHGHLLMVFKAPKDNRDGNLMVGLETVAFGKTSPVGYHHGLFSTEKTASPMSVLHGHKDDKIGVGETADNTRLVDLTKLGDWRADLDVIKADWDTTLSEAENKREAYRALTGPRT